MKQYSQWKDEEVKKLFSFIENGKNKGKTLSYLFEEYAKINGRKPNSVRNYYYAELCFLEENDEKRNRLKIDLKNHEKCEQKAFDESETKFVVSEILRLGSLGFSVRKACLKLSDGNLEKMVRLQNKYRTILQKRPEIVEECKIELKQKGFYFEDKKQEKTNVIKMPERHTRLSDSDINSLFLGLLKLVKKQALEEVENNLQKQTEFANNTLRKTLVEIQAKDLELKKMRQNFKVVCEEREKLKQEVILLRGQNAGLLKKAINNSEKIEGLRKFSKRYAKNQNTAN